MSPPHASSTDTAPLSALEPRPRWSPWRFRLWGLLCLMALAALALRSAAQNGWEMRARAAEIAQLESQIGTLGLVSHTVVKPTTWWERLGGAPELDIREVTIQFGDLDENVDLGDQHDPSRIPLTDAEVAAWGPCSAVVMLDLGCTAISNAALEKLARFPQLVWLDLERTAIGGEGLRHLKTLPSLRVLSLRRCPVDDSVLEALAALKTIDRVDLSGTNISPDGVARLRRQRPELQISYDAGPEREIVSDRSIR